MPKQRNIILITVDSLRADCLSCYGSNDPKTPNIDELAKEGILYRDAFANGANTVTSVSSFLTSKLIPFVKPDSPTIALLLKKAGFSTISINPNVQLVYGYCKELGLTKGFDTYDTMLGSSRLIFETPRRKLLGAGYLATKLFSRNNPFYRIISNLIGYAPFPMAITAPRAREINKKAIFYLESTKQPFFLWLFYLDVHAPYLPPQEHSSYLDRIRLTGINRKFEYFRKNLSQREVERLFEIYKGTVEGLDREVGFLIQVLKEKRLYDDTIIFFTADHGEQFREHGELGHPDQPYNEQLHVPLIIKTDTEMPKGLEVKDTVSLLDLAPTIIKVATTERYESFTGQILPFACDNASHEYYEKPVLAFANVAGGIYCYKKQNWKFICNNQEKELYNLEVDPREKDNIFKKTPEISRQIEREAFDYLLMLKDMHERTELEKRKVKRLARKLKYIWSM